MFRSREGDSILLPTRLLAQYLVSLLLGTCLGAATLAQAQPSEQDRAQSRESNVANVVQGILNYARWPQPPKPLNLCVVAPTQYADLLLQQSNLASVYEVNVERLLIDSPLLEDQCQAVYIGIVATEQRRELFNRLIGKPILSITEDNQGCGEGSLFCLNISDEHVAFQVNLDAVARSGVRIHPNVLYLGKRTEVQP